MCCLRRSLSSSRCSRESEIAVSSEPTALPDPQTCPYELAAAVEEFWPAEQWDNAKLIAYLESGWRWDAEINTTSRQHPCGSVIDFQEGVAISAEHSIGYFQINVCNFPTWNPGHLFNARQNAGTAHMLWQQRGWSPWFFSAKRLGLTTRTSP